jgi:hypothetical protein
MQQQKSKTQYSIPGGARLEAFSKLDEVLLVGLSFTFSVGSMTSPGAWEVSSEDTTMCSELPPTGPALSSLLLNRVFPADFPRTLQNKRKHNKTHQVLSGPPCRMSRLNPNFNVQIATKGEGRNKYLLLCEIASLIALLTCS